MNGKKVAWAHFTKSGEVIASASQEEEIEIGVFDNPVSTVEGSFSYKLALSNYDPKKQYETCDVGCKIVVPCYLEELDRAKMFVMNECKKAVGEDVKSIIRKIKDGKKVNEDRKAEIE